METTVTGRPDAAAVAHALRVRRGRLLDVLTSAEVALADGVLIVPSGVPIPVVGTDDVHRFRAHDDHAWLSGLREPRGVVVCDPSGEDGLGAWTLFVYRASPEDRVWHGSDTPLDELAARTGIDDVRPLAELEAALVGLGGRVVALVGQTDLLEQPAAYGLSPSAVEMLAFDGDLSRRAESAVHAARRVKDDVELAFMRLAAEATVAGHREAMRVARPGMSERELRTELEATFCREGGDHAAYGSIVATGTHPATLHIHPTDRRIADGDLVLIDAGAEVTGYDCDVTRTFPASGTFSGAQREVYEIVLGVQRGAISGARQGVEYRDLHLAACIGIAQGLVAMRILRGRAEDLVAQDAHALFFPHGLGHMIGLSTHDVGGYLAGRERSNRPGLRYLRADLPLEAGHVVTIEPGIYFIEALLRDPDLRLAHADHVDFERAEALLDFGGVRIEDTVHVTDAAAEVLTRALPKSVAEVESACR